MVPSNQQLKMEFINPFKMLSGQRALFFFFSKFVFSMCYVKYFELEKCYSQSFPNIW